MRYSYYIWERESGKLLAKCEDQQDAYDLRASLATRAKRPKTDYRISYE
jgi:hypothetical protein